MRYGIVLENSVFKNDPKDILDDGSCALKICAYWLLAATIDNKRPSCTVLVINYNPVVIDLLLLYYYLLLVE